MRQIAPDLVIAAWVGVLGPQAAEDLSGGVPLLGRGGLIRGQDSVSQRAERPKHGSRSGLSEGVRLWLGLGQGLEDGLGRMAELVGEFADGEAVSAGLPDSCEVVHRQHPFPLGGRG
jgi:hypothetical protein